jgi:hypothetical protein
MNEQSDVDDLFVTLGLPNDRDLLALIGEVSIRHGQHDNALRLVLGTLRLQNADQARHLFQNVGSYQLRKEIKKSARHSIADKNALSSLNDLLTRSKLATDKRNEIFHGVWGTVLDGPSLFRDKGDWLPIPSKSELQQLADEFLSIVVELNYARLESDGFLNKALKK